MYAWACMFENPLPVMENETYTLKKKLSNSIWIMKKKEKDTPVEESSG